MRELYFFEILIHIVVWLKKFHAHLTLGRYRIMKVALLPEPGFRGGSNSYFPFKAVFMGIYTYFFL